MSTKRALESVSLTLALVVKSGKYALGYNQAVRNLMSGKAKYIIVSNNCPVLRKSQIEYLSFLNKTKVMFYENDSRSLGTSCGKTFNVSVFTILDEGDADLKNLRSE